ncbi:MAG: hypothetical protein QXO25_02260 [Candidatus Bathyarchaeia archaeon]
MVKYEYKRLEFPAPSLYESNEKTFYSNLDSVLEEHLAQGFQIMYVFYEKSKRYVNGVYNFILQRPLDRGVKIKPQEVEVPSKGEEVITTEEPAEEPSPNKGGKRYIVYRGQRAVTMAEAAKRLGIVGSDFYIHKMMQQAQEAGLKVNEITQEEAKSLGLHRSTKYIIYEEDLQQFINDREIERRKRDLEMYENSPETE